MNKLVLLQIIELIIKFIGIVFLVVYLINKNGIFVLIGAISIVIGTVIQLVRVIKQRKNKVTVEGIYD